MDSTLALCSVGIPTYNRPDLLSATIAEIRNQSYRELQIIISDNASPDSQVERIGREAAAADPRIRYIRQPENTGVRANFEFVLRQSTGKYFMWAADDDRRIDTYVEQLVAELESRPSAVLCGMEVRYFTPSGQAPFFPQYEAIYEGLVGARIEQIIAMISCTGVANIIYGVFRREALFHNDIPAASFIGPTLNEHPLFALVADKGEIFCLPQIGLFKRTSKKVFRHAKWEIAGGFRSSGGCFSISALRYHRDVFGELERTYRTLDLPGDQIEKARCAARRALTHHAIQLAVGWKPKRKAPMEKRQVDGGSAS